jgi:hypothetical protein
MQSLQPDSVKDQGSKTKDQRPKTSELLQKKQRGKSHERKPIDMICRHMILRHLTRLLPLVATALTCGSLATSLATLFATPVFAKLPANHVLAQAGPGACAGNSAARELDFWVGEWSIAPPGAAAGDAASTVSLELDQCLVVESWRGGKDHTGKNIFGFSQEDKTWHGMFADNDGRVHLFEGTVAAGAADFRGSSRGRNGEAELHRLRIFRLPQDKDKVEQVWEKSSDNGATWAKVFDGVYSRRKQ